MAKNEAGIQYSSKNFPLAVPGTIWNSFERSDLSLFQLSGDQTALIQIVPSDQLVKRSGTAFFDCSYQNADVIEWYFKDVGPIESNGKYTKHSNGTLQINDIVESDQGLYSCVGIRSESAEVPQSYVSELKLACKWRDFIGRISRFIKLTICLFRRHK